MSEVNAFIAKLVKAANDTEADSSLRKRDLLERAVVMISELTEVAELPRTRKAKEAVAYLQSVEIQASRKEASDRAVREALLVAAGLIRELYIISKDSRR